MKPQPPVTKMRIAPRTSSGREGARADFSAGPPDAAQAVLNALESEWMFWLALKYDRVIPRPVARAAALAMALSPGFIFYGRYSIHEAWLLLFSMMFIFGLLGLWREGTLNYLWFTGIGITGMILTKETYIIHLGCTLIALPLAYISTLIIPAEGSKPASDRKSTR